MSKYGIIPSKGVLASLESAGMGGYGSAMVQGWTRVGSGAVLVSDGLTSLWRGAKLSRTKDSVGAKTLQEAEVEADALLKLKAKL